MRLLLCGYRELDLSVATSGLKIPYVTYGGLNMRVVSPFYYPYSTRLSADANAVAEKVVTFLEHRHRTDYFALLQARSETASQLNEAISHTLVKRGISFMSIVFGSTRLGGTSDAVGDGLKSLLYDSGYKTFVVVVEDATRDIPLIAEFALEFGMLDGGDFVWLFTGNIDLDAIDGDWVLDDPAVLKLLSGAAIVQQMDGFMMHSPEDDLSLKSWREQKKTLVDAANNKNPTKSGSSGYVWATRPDFFQTHDPMAGAGFVYERLCHVNWDETVRCPCDIEETNSSLDQVRSIQSGQFRGASGRVEFGEQSDNYHCPGAHFLGGFKQPVSTWEHKQFLCTYRY
uniref:Receptor ligand binding region domain-containing protein n=1 Tax=Grammatophora oceanica TaxID=210454 RepID=A0A7S1Y2M8_9STRA|mmetsp:Transcript_14471/g.21244  ORF Transcript_14471/g.21244 Transcript_14471/m.21244 type:complete len:342 (+) Transcript_14471:342-1367(+)|eukprot:CAMPEP_0194057952 /NCGR_PEP_ID=MMETSP0009_2-20130614/64767_1 /TAXON_ID=210454 /ORGANISM="Grammatophora oceanica, Strain CCMP 410" /LENGTH=341 /DNA_ID=CAMNT_0038707897 /DNA_START=262 /DNA_END=1290 /DNA_ORIENTATION=+